MSQNTTSPSTVTDTTSKPISSGNRRDDDLLNCPSLGGNVSRVVTGTGL